MLRRHARACMLGVRHLLKIEIAKKLVHNGLEGGIPQGSSRAQGEAAQQLRKLKVVDLRKLAKDYQIPAWAATQETSCPASSSTGAASIARLQASATATCSRGSTMLTPRWTQ